MAEQNFSADLSPQSFVVTLTENRMNAVIDRGVPIPGPIGPPGLPPVIQDEGTPLTQRVALNFVGAGVTATDDSVGNRTTVTIPGGAGVSSVFTRVGAVVAQTGDYTVAQVTGAVANTRQVLAGAGMSGGGALSADVTLTALVTSVFGRTGAVVMTPADIAAGGGVPATRVLTAGTGLTGGGDLSADRTFAVVNDTTTQRHRISYAGSLVATRQEINFIAGANATLTVADNPGGNRVDVTVASAAGGSSQTPWLSNIDGGNFALGNVAKIGIGVVGASSPFWLHATGNQNIGMGYDGTRGASYVASINDAGNTNQPLAFQASSFIFYTYTGSGFVGIGVSGNPICKLSLGADITAHKLALFDNGSAFYGFGMDSAQMRYEAGGGGGHNFYVNASAFAMTIAAGGNVGIGVAAPWATQVVSSPAGVYPPASLTVQTPAIWECGITAGPGLAIFNAGSPSYGMVLQARHQTASNNYWNIAINPLGGNVGIGVTVPAVPLDVLGSSSPNRGNVQIIDTAAMAAGTGANLTLGGNYSSTNQKTPGVMIGARKHNATDGDYSFDLAFLAYRHSDANMTERMRIDGSTGFVGIGTQLPNTKVDIVSPTTGDVDVITVRCGMAAVGDGPSILLNQDTGSGLKVRLKSAYEGGNGMGFAVWTTNGATALTEKMRITGPGLVGIGTTGPGYALDVAGDVNCSGVFRKGGTPLNASMIVNAVDATGSYANPAWIASLAWAKITGAPASGGITTRTDFTASRALGTNYQNTTGKTVWVGAVVGVGASALMAAYSDGGNPPNTLIAAAGNSSGTTGYQATVGFWVLPGHWYRIQATGTGNSLQFWLEYS